MKTLNRLLTVTENLVAVGTLTGAFVLAFLSVVLRALGGHVIFWAEEATVYLIIYSTFFGVVIGVRNSDHVNVDVLPVLFRGWARRAVVVLGAVITAVYGVIMCILAWALITEPFSANTLSPALKLPLWVLELSIAVGMTLFFIRAVEMVYRAWTRPYAELVPDPLDDAELEGVAGEEAGRV